MKRPIIGLVGWQVGQNSFGSTLSYLRFLSFFGQIRILTPSKDIDEDLDLVVMPGGKDISSHFYNEVPDYYNSDPDLYKESFFKFNLPKYIENKTPILGICLGMQMICVHFGSKLIQQIGADHETSDPEKRWERVNTLIIDQKFKKYELEAKEKNSNKVCSLHHQGVALEDLSDTLEAIAWSKGDEIVEMVRHKTLPILGIQSHPEEDYNEFSMVLIRNLIKYSPHNEDNKPKRAVLQSAE